MFFFLRFLTISPRCLRHFCMKGFPRYLRASIIAPTTIWMRKFFFAKCQWPFSQVISLKPSLADKNCYQFKLLYGLFVVAIVTGFFSVLGLFLLLQKFERKKLHFNFRNGNREISSFCCVQKPPTYHQVLKQYNAPQMCNVRLWTAENSPSVGFSLPGLWRYFLSWFFSRRLVTLLQYQFRIPFHLGYMLINS